MEQQKRQALVLSDPITQFQLKQERVYMDIKEIRNYKKVLGYVTEEVDGLTYMAIRKPRGLFFQPRIYYLDAEGTLDKKQLFDLPNLLSESGNDLVECFEAHLIGKLGKPVNVLWRKKGSSLPINKGHRIAEYVTDQNEVLGHNLCILDWQGNNKNGKLEVWYGQKIKPKEIRFVKIPI